MKHFDESVKPDENTNWSYIFGHSYKVFIFVGSWSGKSHN